MRVRIYRPMILVACRPSPERCLEVNDGVVCSGTNVKPQEAKWPFDSVPEEEGGVGVRGGDMCLHLCVYPKLLEVGR